MIRNILVYGDARLEQISEPVADFTDHGMRSFVEDMMETVVAMRGLGLAAPQIGVNKRVVVFINSSNGVDRLRSGAITRNDFDVLLNPVIVSQTGSQISEEGCLSIPGIRDKVARPQVVTVEYDTLDGRKNKVTRSGLGAVVLAHEIDHLDGRLFIHYFGAAYCENVRKLLATPVKKAPEPVAEVLAEIPAEPPPDPTLEPEES